MTRRKRRLVLISTALAALGLALGLVLIALRDNIVFFYGPSELAQRAPHEGQRLRIGGLVKQGSLLHEGDSTVRFAVTTDAELDAYLATPDVLEVAGAFTLDGRSAPFVESIVGDPGNVIGLSLPALRSLLGDLGVAITDLWREEDR